MSTRGRNNSNTLLGETRKLYRDIEPYVFPAVIAIVIVGLIALLIYLLTREIQAFEDENDTFDLYYAKNNPESQAYLRAIDQLVNEWEDDSKTFPCNFINCSSESSALDKSCHNIEVPSLIYYPVKSRPGKNGIVYDDNIDAQSISRWMNKYNSAVKIL